MNDADFLERAALDAELTRVFEKCHDCRRCLPLCPSFPALFDAIDAHEQEAAALSDAERRRVIDLCYQCKLCYNNCPYHPPHEWLIDFPKLMSRAKLVQAREEGIPLPERIGQRQDLLGKASCLTASLTNAAFRNRATRLLMEKLSGIDRRWQMPSYQPRPVSRQLGDKRPAGPGRNGRALLFGTCFVEYSEARTARAALQVLEHNGVAVEYGYEICCGAPFLHGGDLDSARRNAARLVEVLHREVRAGVPVLVPGPTCSYQIKHELPELCPGEAAREVAARTYDLGEYLFELAREQKLNREFPRRFGKVAYHLPCHLKSQNIGFRSARLLGLVADEVEMLDHCSGVDGTWGMQARNFDLSQRIADKLVHSIERGEPERVATDCPLAALRIEQRTGRRADHPVILLRDAYGLGERA